MSLCIAGRCSLLSFQIRIVGQVYRRPILYEYYDVSVGLVQLRGADYRDERVALEESSIRIKIGFGDIFSSRVRRVIAEIRDASHSLSFFPITTIRTSSLQILSSCNSYLWWSQSLGDR